MMRRFCFIAAFILFKAVCCPAQPRNYAEGRIKNLQSEGADSILHLTTDHFGPGLYTYEDSLTCALPHYLFWKKNGKVFSQKIKPCEIQYGQREQILHSLSIDVNATPIFNFLASQLDSILRSDVAPLIYKRDRNGRESYEIGWYSHFAVFRLAIYVGDTVFYKSLNPDYLNKDYGYPHLKNLNYFYNQSTAIWKFIDMLDRQINELEEKKIYTFK